MGKIRAVSTHWELGWSFLLLFLVGLVPLVVSLRQYQPCSYTMFGTRRVWHVTVSCHTCIHSHTESCILSPETEKFQCVQLLVVSSEISEWGPPKSLEYENYTSLFFHHFFFFCKLNTESWLSFNEYHYVLELLISSQNQKWAA